jgi:cytochrome bd-type quinol oxidase subunit 2
MSKHSDDDVPQAARTAGSVALLAIALLVGGSVWFLYRVTEKTLEAIDRGIGRGFWLALGIAVAAMVVFALPCPPPAGG